MQHAVLRFDVQDVDSVSVSGSTSVESLSESSRKKKKQAETDITQVPAGAVESIDQPPGSVAANRTASSGQKLDDDWLFAQRIYIKLNSMPPGREKETFKLRMEAELISLTYGSTESAPSTHPASCPT